jgi:hypothetical protein
MSNFFTFIAYELQTLNFVAFNLILKKSHLKT